jgi:hypothetical protein
MAQYNWTKSPNYEVPYYVIVLLSVLTSYLLLFSALTKFSTKDNRYFKTYIIRPMGIEWRILLKAIVHDFDAVVNLNTGLGTFLS